MALKYADFCKRCGKRRTQSPTGLCSYCKRLSKTPRALCKICGMNMTASPDGICSICHRRLALKSVGPNDEQYLDEAIANARLNLLILEKKKEGLSFGEIGKLTGYAKTPIYNRYKEALSAAAREHLPNESDLAGAGSVVPTLLADENPNEPETKVTKKRTRKKSQEKPSET